MEWLVVSIREGNRYGTVRHWLVSLSQANIMSTSDSRVHVLLEKHANESETHFPTTDCVISFNHELLPSLLSLLSNPLS
jgi:hypothetical protein